MQALQFKTSLGCCTWIQGLTVKTIFKNENAFAKIGYRFAKFMKMHLQKPQFFYGFAKAINAFPKPKIGNAFFPGYLVGLTVY